MPAQAQSRYDGSRSSLDRVLPEIRRNVPGTFYDAEGPFYTQDGRASYRIKWMTPDGRIVWFDADARTGRVMNMGGGSPYDGRGGDYRGRNQGRDRYNSDGGGRRNNWRDRDRYDDGGGRSGRRDNWRGSPGDDRPRYNDRGGRSGGRDGNWGRRGGDRGGARGGDRSGGRGGNHGRHGGRSRRGGD